MEIGLEDAFLAIKRAVPFIVRGSETVFSFAQG
jgi:hypothetical protein